MRHLSPYFCLNETFFQIIEPRYNMTNMEVDECKEWEGRWGHVRKILERKGPFSPPSFEPNPATLDFLLENCKILVIGIDYRYNV